MRILLLLFVSILLSQQSLANKLISGKEGEKIILEGNILQKFVNDGWFIYSVEYKGRLYYCQHTPNDVYCTKNKE